LSLMIMLQQALGQLCEPPLLLVGRHVRKRAPRAGISWPGAQIMLVLRLAASSVPSVTAHVSALMCCGCVRVRILRCAFFRAVEEVDGHPVCASLVRLASCPLSCALSLSSTIQLAASCCTGGDMPTRQCSEVPPPLRMLGAGQVVIPRSNFNLRAGPRPLHLGSSCCFTTLPLTRLACC
jgi:hypothetical protein